MAAAHGANPQPGAARIQQLRPEISLQVLAGEGAGTVVAVPATDIRIVGHGEPQPAGWSSVNELWHNSIVGAADNKLADVWDALRSDIELSLTGQCKYVKESRKIPIKARSAQIPGVSSFDDNGAIVARRPNPSDKILVAGVVANNQNEIAIDEERVRAQRVLRRMLVGPGLPGDDELLPDDASAPLNGNYGTATVDDKKKEFQRVIRPRMFADFQQSVDDTNGSRSATKARFDSIKKIQQGCRRKAPRAAEASAFADRICGPRHER